MRRFIAALLVAGAIAGSGISATAATSQRWDRYRSRASGNVVVVKSACIGGEDSMAHVKLVDYQDHGGRIVLGCDRKGY